MSTAVTTEQIEQVVTESLVTFGADPAQITPDATFEALDIDSLDLAELSQIVARAVRRRAEGLRRRRDQDRR